MNSKLHEDNWLASVIGRPAFRLEAGNSTPVLDAGQKRELSTPNAFATCKCRVQDIDIMADLASFGFRLVDTSIIFEWRGDTSTHLMVPQQAEIRQAQAADRETVVEIARASFIYSRFHLDPWFDKNTADKVKAEWVNNYFNGRRGDGLLLACHKGVVSGFLLYLKQKDHCLIDLICVAPEQRGQGLARRLIAHLASLQISGRIQVGTQVANIASARLYEGMGFRLAASNYVLHYHQGSAGTQK